MDNLPIVMKLLGVHLGLDQEVFLKLLNVIKFFMVSNIPRESDVTSVRAFVTELIKDYLLGALTISGADGKCDKELWDIMKTIDFKQRYACYQELLCRGYLINSTMLAKFIDLHPRVVKWSKFLSDEQETIEANRQTAISLANNGNSLIMAHTIIRMITNCENLISPLLKTMNKSFSDLSLDMIAFSILRNLTEK